MNETNLGNLPRTSATHFALYLHAAVVAVISRVVEESDSLDAALGRFPFLGGYMNQLARHGLDGTPMQDSPRQWRETLAQWEGGIEGHLPLRAVRQAYGLGPGAMETLMAVGLVEEDARFAAVFTALGQTTPEGRPTCALLAELHSGSPGEGHAVLDELGAAGLIEFRNPDAPRSARAPHVPDALWTALSGRVRESVASWGKYTAPGTLRDLGTLVFSEAVIGFAQRLPALLGERSRAVVVRGAHHNGRGTWVGAVAKAMGRGLLRVEGSGGPEDPRWRLIGPLATAMHAFPLLAVDPAPGETLTLPPLPGMAGPFAVELGLQGGVAGAILEQALIVKLDMPDEAARRALWRDFAGEVVEPRVVDLLASRYRLSTGHLHRVASLARSHAQLKGRVAIEPADVEAVSRSLNREGLDTLAVPVATQGSWHDIVTDARTAEELATLELRCRHREHLPAQVGESLGAQMNPGVRAMFRGASGLGKSWAARLLAVALHKDLYRVDLSAVVNKYIGVTEKNLNRVFDRAEELDVILLLDEGDSLLGKRTGVQNANDRYANQETNFLLQRLETFGGILVVTTNAPEHVDPAFRRRMDVVIDFSAPQAEERLAIWNLHLPASHAVDPDFLEEVAYRCALTGGQIRNAVVHASLVALDRARALGTVDLEAAVQREYRKAGAVCPLRGRPLAMAAVG